MKKLVCTCLIFLGLEYIVPGFEVVSIGAAIIAALVLGLLSCTIKPILMIISFPINFFTLGLFSIIINGFTLFMTSKLVSGFNISSFWTAVFVSLGLGIIQSFIDESKYR